MLTDPRKYSAFSPHTNIVLIKAQQALQNGLNTESLRETLADALAKENDALINVALHLAPNYATSKLIWQALGDAINLSDSEKATNIFAIPVVLVLGSKNKAKLNSVLKTDTLNQFFVDKEIFYPEYDSFVSGKLIDPVVISGIKQSQLYYWVRNVQQAKLWLPIEALVNSIEVFGEGVFLRFIVGVTIGNQGQSITGLNEEAFNKNKMELMQLINKELKMDGITLFPIPFSPVKLSDAYVIGNEKRVEIAISVAVSNIVRKIREQRLTPIAFLGIEGEAIKLTINCLENKELQEISLWHLNPFDDFDKIVAIIINLLNDVQIEWHHEEIKV